MAVEQARSAGGVRASQHLFCLVSPNNGVCLSTKDQTCVSKQLIIFYLCCELEQLVAQRNGVVGHDEDEDDPSSVTPDPRDTEPHVSPWSSICVLALIYSSVILFRVELCRICCQVIERFEDGWHPALKSLGGLCAPLLCTPRRARKKQPWQGGN